MLVSCFALASCGGNDDKLVVYTEAGFAPYEFYYNNEIVGVDIEIAKLVAEKMGKTLQIEDVNFDTIIGAVKSGKADLGIAGITITAERAEDVDFLAESAYADACRPGNPRETSVEEIKALYLKLM
jgi:polar amino acid transport system substrate-binding protein